MSQASRPCAFPYHFPMNIRDNSYWHVASPGRPTLWRLVMLTCLAALSMFHTSPMAQSARAASASDMSASAPGVQSTTADAAQLHLLRTQLEDAKSFHDRLLGVVYWSLATVAGVAALLIGFNWWINLRQHERDKNDMLARLSSEFRDHANRSMADIERRMTRDIQSLQFDSLRRERESWIAKKVWANALSVSVRALELATKAENNFQVGDALDMVARDFDATVDEGLLFKRSGASFAADLVGVLDKVTGPGAVVAAALKARAPELMFGRQKSEAAK